MLSDTELGHVQLNLETTFPVTLVDPLISNGLSGFVLQPSLFIVANSRQLRSLPPSNVVEITQ